MTRHAEHSARNKFVSQTHDRMAIWRNNDAWREDVLSADDARLLPIWRHKVAATDDGKLTLLQPQDVDRDILDSAILLGRFDGWPTFAVDMGEDDRPPRVLHDMPFQNLRSLGALAPADAAALAAYGQAMVFWHRRHRFCGLCGTANLPRESGHVLTCGDRRCGAKQFPRSDPAVIVLVTRDDEALLGRQASWPSGVYSTIAGFVEPGESLENAVRREVAEETGVIVDAVHYHSSQPWPFPASLMLGFHATATGEELDLRDDELEDVRWFSRDDIVKEIDKGMLALSAPISIAYRLIEHWFDAGDMPPLATLVAGARR